MGIVNIRHNRTELGGNMSQKASVDL